MTKETRIIGSLPVKEILSMNMGDFLKIAQQSGLSLSAKSLQPCNTEFDVEGDGDGDDKVAAIRDAIEDATSTARAMCNFSDCSNPMYVRVETVKASGSGQKFTATGTFVFKCVDN